MSILSQLRLSYFCYFSKPAADRPVYRAIRRQHTRKIVELGIGDGRRALRMIQAARLTSLRQDILYVGIDPFEGRCGAGCQPALTLKAAHQLLRSTGARVSFCPGNPPESLVRAANSLGKVDLLIVPAEIDLPSLAWIWFFVPRMLHQRSLVFVQRVLDDGRMTLHIMPRPEIDALAAAGAGRRAA